MSAKDPKKPPLDPELEAEIDGALGQASVFEMLDETPRRESGEGAGAGPGTRAGRVVDVSDKDVLVEFGARAQGVCPIEQFGSRPQVGDTFPFRVESVDSRTGLANLSLGRHAAAHVEWMDLDVGQVVKATVTGHNAGGLEMRLSGRRAFLPFSHVALERVDEPDQYVGRSLECEILEVDRIKDRIILSRRALLEREREEQRASTVRTLQPGTVRHGTVTRLEPYGAFVDLGGLEGLLHVSNMAYERVQDPADLVELGQEIDVMILSVSEADGRVGLGLKQLQPDPWDQVVRDHPEGSLASGKVVRIADYGAFVQLAPGVEGLLHRSQLAPVRVENVRKLVKEGDEITVRVVEIDPERRRIGLSRLTTGGTVIGSDTDVDPETIRRYVKQTDEPATGTSLGALLQDALQSRKKKGK